MTNPLHAILVALALAAAGPVSAAAAEPTAAKDSPAAKEAPAAAEDDTFDQDEMIAKAQEFFGSTTKGLAEALQKVFEDQGRPNGYIKGEEISGAFGVGLRYGNGTLHRKTRAPMKLYWQGPTIGFDVGGNASKVFTLVYHLKNNEDIFQRIPGVEGTFYVVAGLAINYQQSGDLILAPIRTGVGLRGGVNIGYLHYAKKHSWIPF